MSAATETAPAPKRERRSLAPALERSGLVLTWVVMIAVFSALRPDTFATQANFSTILGSQAVLVVLALGVIIVLTAGDYDLSIAGRARALGDDDRGPQCQARLADRRRHCSRRSPRAARSGSSTGCS